MKSSVQESTPVQFVKGVGPRRAEALKKAGLKTARDLIFYVPYAYIDRNAGLSLKSITTMLQQDDLFSKNITTDEINLYSEVTTVATINDIKEHKFGPKRKMLRLRLTDKAGGFANVVFWNGINYFKKLYNIGQTIVLSGKPETDRFGVLSFSHPEIEVIDPEDEKLYASGRILPKYSSTEAMKKAGLNMRLMRNIISMALEKEIGNIEETLPLDLLARHDFPDIRTSLTNLHFPEDAGTLENSRRRMKFEEIFYYEVFLAIRQAGMKIIERAPKINPKSKSARKLYDSLPFELTGDQKKVINEIAKDIESGRPMNRLLQGDVGSGKTIVAVLAMLMAIDEGYQVAFMAPTEILAEQHFHTLEKFFEPLDIKVVRLLGGQKAKVRRDTLENISTGNADVIVGTHALFQSEIQYNKLGFAVIDEQHRFGVAQRAELKRLAGMSLEDESLSPHILVMTATPIPRTLSMTIYGDLDVSVIREKPKNRKPIITKVTFESTLPEAYEFIRQQVKKGKQAYIVYPLVEKSEKLELKAATEHYERLRKDVFPKLRAGLLHGQMFWYEKEEAMKAFLAGEYDILVATTVIEVGIDIPNATVMLIENAERFGLSQLHQLRGRVGRGADQSYCLLATKDHFKYHIKKSKAPEEERTASIIRLKTMQETDDGFKISEADLRLRGPGDMLGTRQSGMPEFKYLDLVSDGEIISEARREAFEIVENDPQLRKKNNSVIRENYTKQYAAGKSYFDIA